MGGVARQKDLFKAESDFEQQRDICMLIQLTCVNRLLADPKLIQEIFSKHKTLVWRKQRS